MGMKTRGGYTDITPAEQKSPRQTHHCEEHLLSSQARRWNLQIGKLQVAATWEARVWRRLLPRSSACQFQLSQQVPWACKLSRFSRVWLFAALWTVTLQAPLSMGFSRQEYWSGFLCPPPGISIPGNETVLCLLHWEVGSLPLAPPGKPQQVLTSFQLGLLFGPFKSCFHFRDCPGGPVVENPPSIVGGKGLIPGQGARSHILGANKPMHHNERNLCTATRPHATRKTLSSPPPCKNCSHFNELLPYQIREGLLSTYHQQSKIKS